jgi:hypothetical protein
LSISLGLLPIFTGLISFFGDSDFPGESIGVLYLSRHFTELECAGIFRPIRLFNNAPFKGGFLPRGPVFNDKLFKAQKEFILGCHPFKFIKAPLLRRREDYL